MPAPTKSSSSPNPNERSPVHLNNQHQIINN